VDCLPNIYFFMQPCYHYCVLFSGVIWLVCHVSI
jgi:hypothetical protein